MQYQEILFDTNQEIAFLTLNYAKHTIALNNLAVDAQAGIKAFLNQTTAQWQNR
ncbi:MAG: hypothetical protein KAW01_06790 [Deltaproteobacteria bacterium]|nr:hypothetical protein [Deltaproteobacteria bacterium]